MKKVKLLTTVLVVASIALGIIGCSGPSGSGNGGAQQCGANGHSFGIWEIAKDSTETESGQMQRECEVCGETVTKELQPVPEGFILVEAGTFQMGSNRSYSDNKPVHEVTITKPFYMGKYEVTQEEYKKYGSYGTISPSSSEGKGDKYPAYIVSWYNALVYCNKLSIKENLTPCYSIKKSTNPDDWGKVPSDEKDPSYTTWDAATCDFKANGYRLPTEAEWEWLARGGQNYEYAGSDKADDVAWSRTNTDYTGTRDVKTKAPNGYGLYDMSGNVREWCWDKKDVALNDNDKRVLRGGSWGDFYHSCTVYDCFDGFPSTENLSNGFRVVRQAN